MQLWLYENTNLKIEGTIIGFDEYMNVVMDNAFEINTKSGERKSVGRIMLKGDCITLIQRADPMGPRGDGSGAVASAEGV